MSGYDIRPAIAEVARIARVAFVPSVLTEVAEDIPNLQSVRAPTMFLDYIGTVQNAFQTYSGYERVMRLDCVALMGLAQNPTETDKVGKAFVGAFYDLWAVKANRELNGLCSILRVVGDESLPFIAVAKINYMALLFHLEIADFISGSNC